MIVGARLSHKSPGFFVESLVDILRHQSKPCPAKIQLISTSPSCRWAVCHSPLPWTGSCLIPSRTVTYLGLLLDSTMMRASLTPKRLSVLREHLSRFSAGKHVTMTFGRRLLRLLAAAAQAVPLRLLHMHPPQQWFAWHKVNPLGDGWQLLSSGPDCRVLVYFLLVSQGKLIRKENSAVVSYINHQGGGYAPSGVSQQGSQASFVDAYTWGLLESGVPREEPREEQCSSWSSVQGSRHSRPDMVQAIISYFVIISWIIKSCAYLNIICSIIIYSTLQYYWDLW